MLWGLLCAPFVSLLGTFVASLEHLGQSWGALWATWGCIGASWGYLGDPLGLFGASLGKKVRRNPHRKPMALKYRACAQKQASWNLPGGPGAPGETVHELQFRTYPPHAPGIRMT